MCARLNNEGRAPGAIAYPDIAALPDELRDAVIQRGSLNVYRMIMHSPGLAPGFLELAGHTLDDSAHKAARAQLSVNELADLVVTVGFYQLVCNFLNTFNVTTDGEGPVS